MRTFSALVAILSVTVLSFNLHAQNWVDMMQDPNQNFYDVQDEFDQYWSSRDYTERGKGFKAFKRWENFVGPRVFPHGDRTQMYTAMQTYYAQWAQNLLTESQGPNPSPQAGNWTYIGPLTQSSGTGVGRVNGVVIDPNSSTTWYVCAPGGGLWKTTNSGGSWTMWNTDGLAAIGATHLAIDPTNSQVMYLATGDGDAADTYSIGVLKSTNGGTTWNTTNLNWVVTNGRRISKLLIDPSNTQIIHAATSIGMYRSTDGGTTFVQTQAGNFKDAELKPGSPATVYAVTATGFYLSTNSGASYSNPFNNTSANRLAIAVTAANTAYVYMLAGSAANSGFLAFYRSTNSGASFTQITVSSPSNMLGWASAGNDTGGQSWYDLALAASPTNANECVAGGVNVWRTTNGGTSWTLNAHWTGSGAPYVHADHHWLEYVNGTTVMCGNDGGIFRTTNNGGAWSDLSSGLHIAQMYRLGTSATVSNKNIHGWQDNGTSKNTGTTFQAIIGGDGMECIIDYNNASILYGELYYGNVRRSTNDGGSWSTIVNTGGSGVNANGNWVTPYVMHPTTSSTLLIGKASLYQSTNSGTTWTALGATTGGSGSFVQVHYAKSNPSYIYAIKQNAVFRSTNGGTSFTNVTGALPTSAAMTYIYTSTTDPTRVYVTYSGYVSGTKVYMSTDAGATWTNYSTGLPNLPVNCVVYQNASANGVYVGTDVGVYYRDDNNATWVNFFTGLPNVIVNELEIQYTLGKIRAATYGRGIWESDLFSSGSSAPVADFTSNYTSGCPGICIQFTDISSFSPTSWSWSFQGGTPATSTSQNPLICYSAPGTYSVTLTATNANGTDTETKTTYITISTAGPLPLQEGFEPSPTFPPTNWINKDAGLDSYVWARTIATGGYALSTACMWYDNYTLNSSGLRDEMWSPKYDLTTVSTCTLSFDVAYARYDATYSDTLAVLISTDCGQTFTQVWIKGGPTLATAPDNTTAFTPTSTQWRTETVNLNTYTGQPTFMVVFQNRGRWGNNIYVDNINLNGTPVSGPPPTAVMNASSTSTCANGCISFSDASTGSPTAWSWTFPSGTPATSNVQNPGSVCWSTAGTYTVTLTASNANGSSTTTQVITVNPQPTITVTPAAPSYCQGGNVALTAAGGTTYTWSPATSLSATTGANVTASPTATTTYTVTGTGGNGCTRTATVTVTVNPLPTITVTPTPATICSGSSSSVTASGGTSYTWAPGASLSATTGTTVTATPTVTTTYTVTGTNANGCTRTGTVTVAVNPLPTVSVSASSATICAGSNTTLTGTGAASYTWAPGASLSATTGASVTASPTVTTTYTVTGTGSNGCTRTATQTITVNPRPTITATPSTATFCSGGSVAITASGGQNPNSYTWAPASGLSATTGNNVTANPTVTTTYTVTGSASNGCTNTATVLVTVNPLPTVTVTPTPATICSGSSSSITASGGSTYTWTPGASLSATTGATVTATPTVTTVYTVTATSVAGCTRTATQTITVIPSPTITTTVTNATICSGSSTSITASGGVSYTWAPGASLSATTGATVTATPTVTTTYTVTGTSSNGCTRTATRTITVNPSPTVTATAANPVLCSTSSTSITATGASTYAWAPGASLSATTGATVTASPTVTTTYTVTGTGSNGCTRTTTVTVTVTTNPTVTVSPANPAYCPGGNVVLTANGANTYTWAPATGLSATTGTSVTASPTATTSYTVTGTAGGCTNTTIVTVTVYPAPATPTITQLSNVLTCNPAFATYQWYLNSVLISGATNQSYTITQTGTYTVVVTDANGCTATSTGFSAIYTGVEEFSLTHFNLFPNPNDGVFNLEFGILGSHNLTIEIQNAIGQTVYSEKLSTFSGNYSHRFDITSFGKGVYTLSIRNEANQSVKKVIVY
ncbi:MAG: PKD domain-containing protein [Bacteroidia bacterium]|nr:PKD domain-containing protein [Bacteroidia bacterium]